ncbi:hypothetical protein BpHYR1_041148 [Brachionus plicatilis]|uniref:Uncharacterized protein n=1 Tax=Brachionus plicatilis TaxID=10195 RepID=A0A3M7RTD9_BRAPC|nr:hypothetical protein BpHYR1_041148 [Brachionus plicatilis]
MKFYAKNYRFDKWIYELFTFFNRLLCLIQTMKILMFKITASFSIKKNFSKSKNLKNK